LALGSADPRKNMPALVRAYAQLPADLRTKTSLAIVCTHQSLEPRLAGLVDSLNTASRVRFLHQVSADSLVALYNEAALFVFPSIQEGFGLPLLEAMACGTPIVAADNSAIPEIAGDAALLVDPMDADAMAGRMRRVLTDAPLRAALVRAGLRRAATFSWERCARETVDAYARALGQRT
jgi:alpha-1,3-rhamnosyl/mannosyltransferase